MVVLEHDHVREVHPMRVRAADEQRVLLDDAEARRRLPRARDLALPVSRAREA